ncbi:MAG: Glu-tRNA(Gln) amidotransferase subunit GatE [Candidatus Aenigmarchaeota archaeon]|nr:Glu-tRNA(Gln) amidotransferase subunit GatE [Candidatus Aenigmarchaeota archaeon]
MNYKNLGLRVGLEIHQQLDTKHKLFCNCPIKKSTEFPIEVKRRLRAVAGELGGFDPAALYEFLRGKSFVYRSDPESSCLIEMDDEPPKPLNKEALEIVIQVCKILNCNIVDEVHVMRKTVIDGSSVSAFQRTAMIGYAGYMETSFGKINIQTICLEEDAAPALKREGGVVEYRLDRLGIPLVEITTSAEIKLPEQAREVAEKLGMILRSTKVQRGIGTIRQDVNVSIEEGARIEIKGFQELGKIEALISNEAARQVALLEIKNELKKIGTGEIKEKDVTHLFKETKCNFIHRIVSEGGKVIAVLLPKFAGLLKKQCGDRTLGKELSAYAEAYGYGIIHSDEELDKYHLNYEFGEIKKEFGAGERDLILISAGKNPEKAVKAIIERAEHYYIGVPEETRISDNSGSKYTRPLPGSERMYPETDVPPIRIDKKLLDSIKVPKTLLEKGKELEKELPKEVINQLIKSKTYKLFEELRRFNVDSTLIANTLLSTAKDLKRKGFAVERIGKSDWEYLFGLIEKGKISKNAIPDALILITQGKKAEIEKQFKQLSDEELMKIVSEAVKNNPEMKESALMGIIMAKVKSRASGERVSKLLRTMTNN